jgi:hypothetical protein
MVTATLKTLAFVGAFLAGGSSLAMAQNGPATGGERPVAGGARGGAAAYGYGRIAVSPAPVCLLSALPPLQVLALLKQIAAASECAHQYCNWREHCAYLMSGRRAEVAHR